MSAEKKQIEVESQQVPVRDRSGEQASAQSTQEVNEGGQGLLPLVVAHQVKLEAKHMQAKPSDLLTK